VDKTLKDLKRLREETEERFRALLEAVDAEQTRLRDEMVSAAEAIERISGGPAAEVRELLGRLQAVSRGCLGLCARLAEGLREMAALDNARSAELARQVTVLPLERMDLLVNELERRMEALECRLQRLE
jgi:hypothetical protein